MTKGRLNVVLVVVCALLILGGIVSLLRERQLSQPKVWPQIEAVLREPPPPLTDEQLKALYLRKSMTQEEYFQSLMEYSKNFREVEPAIPVRFNLLTVWRDGRLYYQLSMSDVPRGRFTLTFFDANRFKIFWLDPSRYSVGIGGIVSKGEASIDADTYRRMKTWEITQDF